MVPAISRADALQDETNGTDVTVVAARCQFRPVEILGLQYLLDAVGGRRNAVRFVRSWALSGFLLWTLAASFLLVVRHCKKRKKEMNSLKLSKSSL